MAWYWWALIAIGGIMVVFIKVKVLGKMMSKKNEKNTEEE